MANHFPTRREEAGSRRRGSAVLEFVLVFPVLLIVLLAVIEFGLMFGNFKQIAVASRTGAKLAAEQGTLDAAAVAAIKDEVDRGLISAGFAPGISEVVLQHNVGSPTEVVISSAGSGGSSNYPTFPPLPDATVVPKGCVRVSVIVPITAFTPDLLAAFGLTMQGRDTSATTTFAYEAD